MIYSNLELRGCSHCLLRYDMYMSRERDARGISIL